MSVIMNFPELQLNLFEPNQIQLFSNFHPPNYDTIKSLVFEDGRTLYGFQARTIHITANEGNYRTLIAHKTGRGKTICICGLFKLYGPQVLPALVICKSMLKVQWMYELISTIDIIPQVVTHTAIRLDLDADITIVSADTLTQMIDSNDTLMDLIVRIKTIVVDECQLFKNWAAGRTQALFKIQKDVPNLIGLSATPIKNSAREYYPMMKMLMPQIRQFSSFDAYDRTFVDYYRNAAGTMKPGGLRNEKLFREITKNTIIRFPEEEYEIDLPKTRVGTRFTTWEFVDKEHKKAMAQAMKEFIDIEEREVDEDFTYSQKAKALNTNLMRQRHIVGDAKVFSMLEYIREFFAENEDELLAVFIHHKSVGEALIEGLNKEPIEGVNLPFVLRGGMNPEERDKIIRDTVQYHWISSDYKRDRLLIASTMAAGEGLNLQKCRYPLLGERQFNPGNEEQAVGGESGGGRFSRIGAEPGKSVLVTYLILLDSIDEWFSELVEKKREFFSQTMGDGTKRWKDAELMQELMQKIAENGRAWLKGIK